ncbi:riboflavin synthase subunit alpha [Marinobacterium zhoushanense]|uniref:Riboflavin synthase n=1 Tax=Marinobacterium zhoushanense TaxID=1679163 RepID=A0ABQ1KJS5_9GAMM|nr:riboflavin synthase [Marinobacterium zhoushanense]GGB98694.1 riboflavin synthase subunit alpha [Marinobacterium zhoushanense]
MFTGIIEAIGEIADIRMVDGDMRLQVRTGDLDLSDVKLGDSIATNGVCLTAVALPGDGFVADVSCETLTHTRFPSLKVGERVNLEKAMMPTSRFGGHIVTGHVDGLGKVIDRRDDARSVRLWIQAPKSLLRYIAAKGSITVDGVSLTVNSLEGDRFGLNIVPHTAQETIIDTYRAGREVHLEVDIIARYLERLMAPASDADNATDAGSGLTLETLAAAGFMRR